MVRIHLAGRIREVRQGGLFLQWEEPAVREQGFRLGRDEKDSETRGRGNEISTFHLLYCFIEHHG